MGNPARRPMVCFCERACDGQDSVKGIEHLSGENFEWCGKNSAAMKKKYARSRTGGRHTIRPGSNRPSLPPDSSQSRREKSTVTSPFGLAHDKFRNQQ